MAGRLGRPAHYLETRKWLDGVSRRVMAMMIHVLAAAETLRGFATYPVLVAYVARGEGPAYQRAFAAQYAINAETPPRPPITCLGRTSQPMSALTCARRRRRRYRLVGSGSVTRPLSERGGTQRDRAP